MALNVTAESLDSTISTQGTVESAQSNLKVPEGLASEHIYIVGDDPDPADAPTIVSKQFTLSNPRPLKPPLRRNITPPFINTTIPSRYSG